VKRTFVYEILKQSPYTIAYFKRSFNTFFLLIDAGFPLCLKMNVLEICPYKFFLFFEAQADPINFRKEVFYFFHGSKRLY
jgi:hypothetical protein